MTRGKDKKCMKRKKGIRINSALIPT